MGRRRWRRNRRRGQAAERTEAQATESDCAGDGDYDKDGDDGDCLNPCFKATEDGARSDEEIPCVSNRVRHGAGGQRKNHLR